MSIEQGLSHRRGHLVIVMMMMLRMRIQIVSLTECILWFASKDPSPQFYFVFRHQKGDTENLLAAGFKLGFAAH